jgi:polar amino acid transport system substrate-binding protein
MKTHRLSIYFASFMLVVFNLACSQAAFAQGSKLFEVLDRGKVIVGTTSEVPPFAGVDTNGNLEGFDIDVARLIAKALFEDETKIEFKRISWAARWQAASTGEIDFGIMNTTIWPDRLARATFTRAYVRSQIVMVVASNSPLKSLDEMNNDEITVAILDTPSEHKIMENEFPKATPLILGSEADMATAVKSGRAQGLLLDAPIAAYRVKKGLPFRTLGGVSAGTRNAIFLRQGDFEWWYYLDQMVAEMRCGSLYPEYSAIYNKWFDVNPPSPDHCLKFSD